MRPLISFLCCISFSFSLFSQDNYDQARAHFNDGDLDSARYFINLNLAKKPSADDYFLSGMIHEAEAKDLRALADYEAVIKFDPSNLEAYFQKGLIYYHSASTEQAIEDFTFVIDNQEGSETKAVYYANDPSGDKGTFLATLQSMVAQVYQFRGLAYQKIGEWEKALTDFNSAMEYDASVDCLINRSQLYAKMGREDDAIIDLKSAITLDSTSYKAWYNLAILDESTALPMELLNDTEFIPMLNLMGANAYESGDFGASVQFHSKAIEADPEDDLALISRGKALLRTGGYTQARQDFIKAMQLEPSRVEAFYLIGNSLYHEKKFKDAVGFYEQYLSIDASYENVWFNAAMAYMSLGEKERGCQYLKKASDLGMKHAIEMAEEHCGSQ